MTLASPRSRLHLGYIFGAVFTEIPTEPAVRSEQANGPEGAIESFEQFRDILVAVRGLTINTENQAALQQARPRSKPGQSVTCTVSARSYLSGGSIEGRPLGFSCIAPSIL
ncbi:MAG: hypothetical protein KC729_10765 [Candidatus Eisenbacteria bacterium]|uniref:Uncharacterized protein n=1 Tax=Eiseniibacteriota bacterium TaxID=2212470 RepID=A0A956RP30_UNCEI|nr:hypothetical protein [Candidatus Eisenbacteria bacterium]